MAQQPAAHRRSHQPNHGPPRQGLPNSATRPKGPRTSSSARLPPSTSQRTPPASSLRHRTTRSCHGQLSAPPISTRRVPRPMANSPPFAIDRGISPRGVGPYNFVGSHRGWHLWTATTWTFRISLRRLAGRFVSRITSFPQSPAVPQRADLNAAQGPVRRDTVAQARPGARRDAELGPAGWPAVSAGTARFGTACASPW
jgi:hypothetical protein